MIVKSNYYNKKLVTKIQSKNSYKTILIKPYLFQQYKKINGKKKKNEIYYIYKKLGYFIKNSYLNNITKKKQINNILKKNYKV